MESNSDAAPSVAVESRKDATEEEVAEAEIGSRVKVCVVSRAFLRPYIGQTRILEEVKPGFMPFLVRFPDGCPFLLSISDVEILLGEWQILMDQGWRTFCPGVPFEARKDEEFVYERESASYRVTFQTETIGEQEDLKSSKRRPLRLKSEHIEARQYYRCEGDWAEWHELERDARESWSEVDALSSRLVVQWRWEQFKTWSPASSSLKKMNPLRWSRKMTLTQAMRSMDRRQRLAGDSSRALILLVSLNTGQGRERDHRPRKTCEFLAGLVTLSRARISSQAKEEMRILCPQEAVSGLRRVQQNLPFLKSLLFQKADPAHEVDQLEMLDEAGKALEDWKRNGGSFFSVGSETFSSPLA